MTSPNPWNAVDQTGERDALHEVTRMLVGTKMLQDEPGVVYSLAAQQARPQDAQAIDQFMQALDAEKMVQLARASISQGGQGYIALSPNQKTLLDANGVAYDDVLNTSAGNAQLMTQRIQDASNGALVPVMKKDGTLATDAQGNIQTAPVHLEEKHNNSGWFSGGSGVVGGVGSFLGRLSGAVKDAGSSVLEGMNKAWNFVGTPIAKGVPLGLHDIGYDVQHGTLTGDPKADLRFAQSEVQDMQTQGYDPNSIWSTLAFQASGKAHTDLSSLNDKFGEDKVNQALLFLKDPEGYRQSIEADPNSWAGKDASGRPILTPDARAKLRYLGSKDFEDLARQVNAHQATIGNDVANAIGVDPIKHPLGYGITAAGANLAASLVIDPTMIALKGVQVAKAAAVGIDTLGDGEKAASILTRKSLLPWVNNVQRGWQRAIDLAGEMRTAHAAGDTVKLSQLTAQFNAELPALSPVMGEFIGAHALTGWEEAVVNGEKTVKPVFGATGGIKSLDEAADWVRSKHGLNLLQNGRAATQSSLMPGALSTFGYRKLKGVTAAWMTGRSGTRAEKAYNTVLDRASADPALGDKLIDEGILMRMPAEADDAVDITGRPLVETLSGGGLPSAQRGALAITDAGKGQIVRNIRATGDPLADASKFGWASPQAIAARSRLAAQRLSTLLPRNTLIDINDASSGDKIYKQALTYLNRGDAQALRAAWNFGDGGQKKAIVSGLIDQLGHAAGLGKTESGQNLLNSAKTALETYSAAGSEIELNGQRLALFEGQTRDKWLLPSFQQLQHASAKLGLWESTMGRALTSSQADSLMSAWKIILLGKPSTITRNQLEGWLRLALDGKVGDAVKARAMLTARNKELWDRGLAMDSPVRAEYEAALASGDAKLAKQIANGSMLSGQMLGRSTLGTKLADAAPLALVGRAYRSLVGRTMDDEDIDAFLTMDAHDVQAAMEGYGQQIAESDLGIANSARQATETAKAGFGPAKMRWNVQHAVSRQAGKREGERVEWTMQPLDGMKGAERYANALAQRVNAMPETAKAAIEVLTNPTLNVEHLIPALEKEMKNTAWGKVFFEDPHGAPNVARQAVSSAEEEAGKRDWAQKILDEYTYLLHGQNGLFQDKLAKEILNTGKAPDGDWIATHLTGDNRPEAALAEDVTAMPNGGDKTIPQTLQDVAGGAYQWMVERVLQRTTSSPAFMANYTIARRGLNKQVEQLIESGISPEAANNLAKELATRNAWVKTEQLIDDPGQKTQFDVIARNMIPFARATQAMIRRWGTGLWQNPANARKMMLAYEGAVHSGLIYDNVYGEPTFTYPGSGVLNMVMRAIGQIPGFENVAAFPTSASMTGGVLMSVPGADNPFRMSMGPMISIPLREVYKHLLPTSWQGDALKVDSFINGPIGAGETWVQLVPTAVRKFYQAMHKDDRNSALASSTRNAFANLAAAGLIPPTDASPAEFQQFRTRLQTQTQNHLFLRAVFGLFAPAAPSAPSEATSNSGADYAWSLDGIKGLSDEYKVILNDVGGDSARANVIFTALHPDEVVYDAKGHEIVTKLPSAEMVTQSGPNAAGAYLPSTDSALNWMTTHQDFVNGYKSVAAYFLPEPTSTEPFSEAAHKAQLELGLRINKTPQEFMNDVYVKHAESAFYPTVQKYDQLIAAAKANGDSATENYWTAQKSQWESQYKAINPLFGAKQDNYGLARATAQGQLLDLRKMVRDGDVPDGLGNGLRQLITAFDNYNAFCSQHKGQQKENIAARDNALAMLDGWAQQKLAGTPLASVYNGVFRVLNTNLTQLPTGSTS